MMLRPVVLALLAVLCLAGPAPAAPRDPDVPKVDASGPWRVMHQTNEKSTSKCIGNPVTAACAAETKLACHIREDIELCRIAMGPDNPPKFTMSPERPDPRKHERYRIVLAKRVRTRDIDEVHSIDRSYEPDRLRPGDIMIKTQERACWVSAGISKCASLNDPHEISTRFYFVRKSADRWIVIDRITQDP